MPVSSQGFLNEARWVFNEHCSGEDRYRLVVSRAYYGLYHCALEHADALVAPPLSACGGGSHAKVSSFYQDHYAGDRDLTRQYRKIGINLLRLHGQRVKADYKLVESVFIQDSESVLLSCESLFAQLIQLKAAA
ncbi:hypothetical protein [Stutzerimonas nitrititolerans]|uniref:hypothetical protein n=1 Tax=Stutzerimonas nitrititolerans TaxID=2482751 RepID=UPI003AA7ABBF